MGIQICQKRFAFFLRKGLLYKKEKNLLSFGVKSSLKNGGLHEQEKKGKRKVQGVPQSQTAALPRPEEEEETDKSKQAQTEQTYEVAKVVSLAESVGYSTKTFVKIQENAIITKHSIQRHKKKER